LDAALIVVAMGIAMIAVEALAPGRRWPSVPGSFVVRSARLPTFALVLALGLAGSASTAWSKEDLQSLGEDEGIVIGSFVINVEKGEAEESGLAFLKGRKAGDSNYGVSVVEKPTVMNEALGIFKTSYRFEVKPEQEFAFIKKLPAGTHRVRKIEQLGFSNLVLDLAVDFTVRPGQTTYIGRLAVLLPSRVRLLSEARVKVTDAQEEAINLLRKEHGDSVFSSVVKELMK